LDKGERRKFLELAKEVSGLSVVKTIVVYGYDEAGRSVRVVVN
jgi:hypothetical protein